ncbi:MAG: 5'-methylthioadenosine/adenosylhomocysteine nucleosidase [Firmicutes bacterium]|nr:5'-methylthioadenosine/adenosylhomocysteine nucleosidase [Bacillota bacterium]
MKYTGIIVAIEEEMQPIKDMMQEAEGKDGYNLTFYEGKIGGKNYVLVKSGVGKVNAARAAQIMIDKYDLDYIINIGSAGALSDDLDIYDFVIGKDIIQHDFDITAFGHEKGYITDVGTKFHSSDTLIEKYLKIINSKVKIGTIATGDTFLTDIKAKKVLIDEFNADCVDMEAAAIGQVCTLCEVPFIAVKSISDKLNCKNNIQFEEYIKEVSKKCAEIIVQGAF